MKPKVSVNIAVKDRRALLAQCLEGLAAQTYQDFEVIVVDNGSSDGTPEEGRRARGLTIRVLTELGSLGAVRNAGLAASVGEIVAFVDSDCVPTPDWLTRGVAAFADPGATPVATVQGATLPDPTTTRGRWHVTQEITAFTHRYEACNLFYRRDVLVDAGGFDERIGFFGEDSAAGWAVRRLGLGERFAPDAVVHHAVTHPGLRWHLRRGLSYGNWNALVRRFPEMRTTMFWHRIFLRRESAQTLLALAGGLVAVTGAVIREPAAAVVGVVCVAPFAWRHRPYTWRRRSAIVDALGGAGFDLAVEVGLLLGSIRERTLLV
ncbi:MAG TPA: glycosyltransferase family A protein [Acidimicrobiales bacterium]|nr:glycosyltransferase family A protein [Acidimicrobiales bacterium]